MDLVTIAGVGITAAGFGLIAWRLGARVDGYEDESGLHFGEPRPTPQEHAAGAFDPGCADCRAMEAEPREPANCNLPSLTPDQCAVLMEMGGDFRYSAAMLARYTGLPLAVTRQAQRDLRDKGLADFGTLYDGEGHLAGRGYWLNGKGMEARARLHAAGKVAA